MNHRDTVLKLALAQIAPVMFNRQATMAKVVDRIHEAAAVGCRLVTFGEGLVPGYPFWLSRTDSARFEAKDQKELYALYVEQAVQPEAGDLDDVCAAAKRGGKAGGIAVVLGIIERAKDRGGHSVYCSRVYIEPDGTIGSVHRKLMPTYEERLAWAIGDGAGLVVHSLGPFTVGALNCWENWMPLARSALYAQGEDLHIAIWPGGMHNTPDITRFIAMESRSFVMSVSGLLRAVDIPFDVPYRDRMVTDESEIFYNGASCACGPDGSWLLEPVLNEEGLHIIEIDHRRVLEERQNFDPSGHYARPDVLQLKVDRRRQVASEWIDD